MLTFRKSWISDWNRNLKLAIILRLIFIVIGEFADVFSKVKYTDIDYWVFHDAAINIVNGKTPFSRSTYRYTPILALILYPNYVHKLWGKLIFSAADLIASWFMFKLLCKRCSVENSVLLTSFMWLFNPMVFVISTRGNAESIMCSLILATIYFLYQENWTLSAMIYGFAVHFKLFPAIFIPGIFSYFINGPCAESCLNQFIGAKPSKIPQPQTKKIRYFANKNETLARWFAFFKYALVSFATFSLLTLAMYTWYGGEVYLQESIWYHLVRKDHRHNFSPYFLPFYLEVAVPIGKWANLFAFLPQLLLLVVVGLTYGGEDIVFSCFLQTFLFVTFNKVCTSQYFSWFLCLLPVIGPTQNFSFPGFLFPLALWFITQSVWLNFAYELEFLGKSVFQKVWIASLLFLISNTIITIQFIVSYATHFSLPKTKSD